jgi:hypothetical protein
MVSSFAVQWRKHKLPSSSLPYNFTQALPTATFFQQNARRTTLKYSLLINIKNILFLHMSQLFNKNDLLFYVRHFFQRIFHTGIQSYDRELQHQRCKNLQHYE